MTKAHREISFLELVYTTRKSKLFMLSRQFRKKERFILYSVRFLILWIKWNQVVFFIRTKIKTQSESRFIERTQKNTISHAYTYTRQKQRVNVCMGAANTTSIQFAFIIIITISIIIIFLLKIPKTEKPSSFKEILNKRRKTWILLLQSKSQICFFFSIL